ncbi:helix-turn-helix domain-containing protein [Amycolatopsis samaneae]|uniref:Helix-turn-helix domain-containing protein n=1 Tax=Amycolatopsis samaneae TaxID=664691 RepID=A0ABW5GKD8_9PSEU
MGAKTALRGERRQRIAAKLAQRYRDGERLITALASEVGRRPGTVRRVLLESGIELDEAMCPGVTDGEVREQLVRQRTTGLSVCQLTAQTGLSLREVRGHLRAAGALRTPRAIPTAAWAELKRRYDGGTSIRQLARQRGCSFGTVRDALKAAGATLRPRGASARKT